MYCVDKFCSTTTYRRYNYRGGIGYINIKLFFVDRCKLFYFGVILIFFSVMFDRAWKEFCVRVVVSPSLAMLLGPFKTFLKPLGRVLVG